MNTAYLKEAIERIRKMEACFDTLLFLPAEARQNPDYQAFLAQLKEYYEGGQWLRDYELDEQGLLPRDLKRGVLSQDSLYDFLATHATE